MHTFSDNEGHVWTLSVTVGAIKRVRALCGVDLARIVEFDADGTPDPGLLGRLASDPVLLVDVLYALVKPEADGVGVTDEDFGESLAGDCIEAATKALLEETVDFFPSAKRKILRRLLDAIDRYETRMKEEVEKILASDTVEKAIDMALDRLPSGA